MTAFIFAGDMLVMAFMMGVVVWVYMKSSRETLDASAQIPLDDEAEPQSVSESVSESVSNSDSGSGSGSGPGSDRKVHDG